MDDRELLREYVERRSQDAFRQLVDRHLPMVYSAARRLVRDPHLAEDVAQGVFTTLAQKAESLSPPQVVGGWLYNTTRHFALHAVRAEQRRREREQTAVAMQILDLPLTIHALPNISNQPWRNSTSPTATRSCCATWRIVPCATSARNSASARTQRA